MRHERLLGKSAYWGNILTICALATTLLALVNIIAVRVDRTLTLPGVAPPLSPRSLTMLQTLRGEIRCKIILPRSNIFFPPLRHLMLNIKAAAKDANLHIEEIDPHSEPAKAAQAIGKTSSSGWTVAFERDGLIETLKIEDLVEKTEKNTEIGALAAPVRYRFKGEQVCVTSLVRLTHPKSTTIYALCGHGERDFNSYDALSGYSDFSREIAREGYTLRHFKLGDGKIPADCDLLLIAGPKYAPTSQEAAAIDIYLKRGGRLLLLIDRFNTIPNGWEPLMDALALSFANLTAVRENSTGSNSILVDRFSPHPVARDLEKSAVYFSNPQVFDIATASTYASRANIETVAAAPDGAWGETDPDTIPHRYDVGVDRKGKLPLAVAIEFRNAADLGIKTSRAFVIGDSNFAANSSMAGGRTANRDLLLNAINWLTDSGLASTPSLPAEGNALRLGISRNRQLRFWCHSVFWWPLATGVLGIFMAKVRKLTL